MEDVILSTFTSFQLLGKASTIFKNNNAISFMKCITIADGAITRPHLIKFWDEKVDKGLAG